MADVKPRYTDDVPDDIETRLRTVCLALPDAYEERAWVGARWMVRKRTFAHVLGVVDPEEKSLVVMTFRSAGEEADVLRMSGHPFFAINWGRNAIGMVLDAETDWDDVSELLVESFCLLAPKKLIALVDRPGDVDSGGRGAAHRDGRAQL